MSTLGSLKISQPGFKMHRRTGIAVSTGDRAGAGQLTLTAGAVNETITITAEAIRLQTQSTERWFTIMPQAVEKPPIANGSFASLAELTPGVSGASRIGDSANSGGVDANVMMDGVSTMDMDPIRLLKL